MRKKRSVFNCVIFGVVIILTLFTVIMLIRFSNKFNENRRVEELKKTLNKYLEENGARDFLEFSGVPVDELYYKNEYIPLFQGSVPSWTLPDEELSGIYVFNKCSPAVVFITDGKSNSGSGFFISSDGYVCTNYHVVSSSDSITVRCFDDSEYKAELLSYDRESDIALLKVNPEKNELFSYLDFQKSENLFVGQNVYIIGSPFGYAHSISKGIISALGRQIRDQNGNIVMGMIQTDAAVNFGNSGGPLLNSAGELIGITSSVYKVSELSEGMNFCFPASELSEIITVLKNEGAINRGWIDFYGISLNKNIVDYASLKTDKGILVDSVVSGGNAEKSGLRGGTRVVEYGNTLIHLGGDIITSVNGTPVNDLSDLYSVLRFSHPGDIVNVSVNRNGATVKLKIELTQRTEEL